MEPLALSHTDETFRYDQVTREGQWAIYRQTHKASGAVRFELIRIQTRAAKTWPDGRTTPAHEAYPGSQSWGRMGWSFHTLEAAQVAMQRHLTPEPALAHEEGA